MGRPIRDQWTNEIRTPHATLEGLLLGNELITGLCKIGANAVAKYTIVQQKGTNKFRIQDSAGNEGTCTLVNKPADLSSLTAALADNEMVMNCIDSNAVKHRVMKLMNRTLIYETDANVSKRAMWGWDAAAAAAGADIETVQLQEVETVFGSSFVEYNGITEFGAPQAMLGSNGYTENIPTMIMYLNNNSWAIRNGNSMQDNSTALTFWSHAYPTSAGLWSAVDSSIFNGNSINVPFSLEIDTSGNPVIPNFTLHAWAGSFTTIQTTWNQGGMEEYFMSSLNCFTYNETYQNNQNWLTWYYQGQGDYYTGVGHWTFKLYPTYQG